MAAFFLESFAGGIARAVLHFRVAAFVLIDGVLLVAQVFLQGQGTLFKRPALMEWGLHQTVFVLRIAGGGGFGFLFIEVSNAFMLSA